MFALKPPVPRPITTIATLKQASAPLGCTITGGMADMMRMMWPSYARINSRSVAKIVDSSRWRLQWPHRWS